ncbi:hypothetical protein [Sphingomonas aerophila]|uniref:Uncharacterized protein n=1 Tax=Sphingomonas aerophila TaxID=1344948 RepID=A0A7W9BER6_9SPHN|nr:hypothetical protein [Sphingomonas aerophila]MBB5715833.1 hypothetical protein [Sphingomonas aerophila]
MINRSTFNRLLKVDLHFMAGDRKEMADWLNTKCQHPYILACMTYKGMVSLIRTTRVQGDPGVSSLWQKAGILGQDYTFSKHGTRDNADFLTGTMKGSEPRAWYVIFDNTEDKAAFRKAFKKAG